MGIVMKVTIFKNATMMEVGDIQNIRYFLQITFNLGDCCLPVIDSTFCSECICHEDGTRHPDGQGNILGTTSITQPTETFVYQTCFFSSYNGDGQCDETNNNPDCNYDDG